MFSFENKMEGIFMKRKMAIVKGGFSYLHNNFLKNFCLENNISVDILEKPEDAISNFDEYDFVYNDQHLHVTISGGVSVFDSSKNPVTLSNVLVNQADSVLYESKQNGRNRITVFKAKK